ncbi:aminodeoxychorismate/anthranilate synthase component II [Alteromonas stellipolaris]|uniref:anthranilate synthase component II n=1 Tax=Alteromonas stellipolaris TaxID=233316 RepID=UPI002117562C|nr:aminodeoxychorismate/anthranilate synthase component II [Alteromonas stellipolaris]
MLLLIDNFDSFTHNLARYLTELGACVKVVRNNALSIADIEALSPSHLVISPGPCTPNESGISLEAIKHFAGKIPLLGVCLGHQAIGQVFGASVIGAKEIKHGKTSALFHKNRGLFSGFEQGYAVTRYHSLVLDESHFPESLNIDAWCVTDDGEKEIMGISHKALPIWGVQFHPESLLTEYGHDILSAFLNA